MEPRRFRNIPPSLRVVLFTTLGVLGGLAWYWFVGCRGGGCPLTSDPWIMALFGAAMGLSLGWPDRPDRDRGKGPDRDVV